jgi:hypothetical protein
LALSVLEKTLDLVLLLLHFSCRVTKDPSYVVPVPKGKERKLTRMQLQRHRHAARVLCDYSVLRTYLCIIVATYQRPTEYLR